MREQGTIDPDYPEALPVLMGITKEQAERFQVMFGTLMYGNELEGELVYTGPVNDMGELWHEVEDQGYLATQGINYLRQLASRFM